MILLPVFLTEQSSEVKNKFKKLSEKEKSRFQKFLELSKNNTDISNIPASLRYHTLSGIDGFSSIYLDNKNKRAIFKKEKINDKNYLVLFDIITDHKEYKRINKKSNEDDSYLDFHF